MTIKKYEDTRISRDLCAWQLRELADEYLSREFGRKSSEGWRMTWDYFETESYATGNQPQINVYICFIYKTITLSHK